MQLYYEFHSLELIGLAQTCSSMAMSLFIKTWLAKVGLEALSWLAKSHNLNTFELN